MLDFKCVKNVLNPLNAVITGVIIFTICIRVISNNQENEYVIESVSATDTQVTLQMQTQVDTIIETVEPEATSPPATPPEVTTALIQTNNVRINASDPLAYSAELDKTFNLEAFNKLSKEELMTFSGIGEVTAQAILDYRKENGPFNNFDDLMQVKGIGEKKLQKIMMIIP